MILCFKGRAEWWSKTALWSKPDAHIWRTSKKLPTGKPMKWYKVFALSLWILYELEFVLFLSFSIVHILKSRRQTSALGINYCGCAQTSFKIPLGTSPVVVDLQGMGKGHAWVNGNSLGRYWPSQIADTNGCSNRCDYRGEYKPEKCVTNCGSPSQRWYNFNHFCNKVNDRCISSD